MYGYVYQTWLQRAHDKYEDQVQTKHNRNLDICLMQKSTLMWTRRETQQHNIKANEGN